MIDTHDSLHNIRKNNSKIKDNSFLIRTYAKSLKKDFDLIFFDEFQVTNIADAMILGQLFIELFDLNIKIVLTSNDKPKDLYKDGLQRELFLPFIILIESNSNIFNLNIKKDYRISGIDRDEIFFSPISNENYKTINDLYKNLIDGHEPKDIKIEIKKRSFEIKKFANNVARFNFNELCGQPLGSEDYLKLIQNIKTLFLENVPAFSDDNVDKQERFITLIDILYDNEVKLIMSADKSLENFTSSRRLDLKFKRTCSRLSEMKSQDYWRNNQ
jgi:cell division protein ZapE